MVSPWTDEYLQIWGEHSRLRDSSMRPRLASANSGSSSNKEHAQASLTVGSEAWTGAEAMRARGGRNTCTRGSGPLPLYLQTRWNPKWRSENPRRYSKFLLKMCLDPRIDKIWHHPKKIRCQILTRVKQKGIAEWIKLLSVQKILRPGYSSGPQMETQQCDSKMKSNVKTQDMDQGRL